MSFNGGADVLQRVGGGRFNVPIAEDDLRARSGMMPEYVLVEAVLREAIKEYQKFAGQHGRRSSRLFREVREWFFEDDCRWDFSFINVCQILDLEPTYIRTGLKSWCDRNVGPNVAQELRKTDTRRTRRRQENLAQVGVQAVV